MVMELQTQWLRSIAKDCELKSCKDGTTRRKRNALDTEPVGTERQENLGIRRGMIDKQLNGQQADD